MTKPDGAPDPQSVTAPQNAVARAHARLVTLVAPFRKRGVLEPVVYSALILLGSAFQLPSLHFGGDTGHGIGLELIQPLQYILVSPVARVLDEVALVTESQHFALLASIALIGAWWSVRRYAGRGKRSVVRQALGLGLALSAGLAMSVSFYLVAALVPRPMVRLVPRDPSVLLVDFHSHTDHSHDGRWRFDAEANRAWHASAGFHAAYVTDHQTMRGWQALSNAGALAGGRPTVRIASVLGTGGEGATMLLPGIETVVPGAHLALLGVSGAHAALFSHRRDLDTLAFATVAAGEPRLLTVLTLPYNLERDPARIPVVDAVEISNGSPRGLAFARRHRLQILALADSLQVPLVASSNNHGWGSTAAAWTALRIPGWQRLSPLDLEAAIRATLRAPSAPVGVAERNALALGSGFLSDAATLPRLLVHAWRIARPLERIAALAWLWGIWLLRGSWRAGTAAAARQRTRSIA